MKTLSIGLVIGASLASSVGGTFRSLGNSIGQLQEKTKNIKVEIAAGESWKNLRGESLKLSAALQTGKLDAEGAARFQELKRATAEAAAEAKKYGFTLGDLNKRLGTMQTWSDRQDGRLKGTLAVGAAMFAYPLKAAMDFEQGMAEVGAISRASAEDMARLTKNARDMGRDTKFTATEAAHGQKYLAMAGTTFRGMLDSLTSLSEKARQLLKELKVKTTDTKGDLLP